MKTEKNRSLTSATHKLLVRGGIDGETQLLKAYTCPYGSQDKLFKFWLQASDPQRSYQDDSGNRIESAKDLLVEGVICLHLGGGWNNPQDFKGPISLGHGCGTKPIQNDPFDSEEREAVDAQHREAFASSFTVSWYEPVDEEERSETITFGYDWELKGDEKKAAQNVLKAIQRLWSQWVFEEITEIVTEP